jgi:hypothetical protein
MLHVNVDRRGSKTRSECSCVLSMSSLQPSERGRVLALVPTISTKAPSVKICCKD